MPKIANQKLQEGELIKRIINQDRLKIILENLGRGRICNEQTIWALFALELWYETHFKDRAIR